MARGKITRIVGGTNSIECESWTVYTDEFKAYAGEFSHFTADKGINIGDPEFPPLASQPIKIIVQFRPHKDWRGEFGFDWFRLADTMLFHDVAFTRIVAYQYSDYEFTKIVDNSKPDSLNMHSGQFKPDEKMLNQLKQVYQPYTIPWKTTKNPKTGKPMAEEYFIPWMSILKDKEVNITFIAEIKEEADYLEFPSSDYFIFTPNRIDIKGKKSVALNEENIIIKCVKEFETDQTIELKAFKKDAKGETIEAIAGKINVWANDISKQKEMDVVFIEIKTPEINGKKNKPIVNNEKENITQYLRQAYIQLSDNSDIIMLDLSADADFYNFIVDNEINKEKRLGNLDLEIYLKMKLKTQYKEKYNNHFKAFYFAETGYGGRAQNLGGYSVEDADFVVVFNGADQQTATHELLHSMGLAHIFTNKYTDPKALFTYMYQMTDNLMDYTEHESKNKRCSLYYWQWKIINNSIKKII
ncbi:hypothetical protein VUJ46_13805 [Chryseobacterium sp. MYb264]|uniref:hypothetical protein n=1 Tax=Chryseobacterium sp. MYb264 TaxID=2745153 RepID=UPI002E13BBD8|nr:hypothetical protein VUJ46_13805 [Chryseobacterium sp. MYb264]